MKKVHILKLKQVKDLMDYKDTLLVHDLINIDEWNAIKKFINLLLNPPRK